MSQNIDNMKIRILEPISMATSDVINLLEEDLPEDCFLHRALPSPTSAHGLVKYPRRIQLEALAWCGAGSGSSFESFKTVVLPKLKGHVQLKLTWESGGEIGLEVKDGVVQEHEVTWALGEVKG